MSYEDDFSWNLRQWDPATSMILDVLALQYMYGKNMATNAGDSSYSLSRSGMYSTLWDASGADTVSVNGQFDGWVISLPDTQLSSLVDTKAGYATPMSDMNSVAPSTLFWLAGDFENAIGSNSADLITGTTIANSLFGNGGNDVLTGAGGNDTIQGGTGLDFAVYSGHSSNYTMQRVSADSFLLADDRGTDGTDTLTSIERLSFSSSMVAFDMATNQSGGMAVLLVGAVLGRQAALAKKDLLGTVIELFDAGFSFRDLSGAVMRLDIWSLLAGNNSSSAVTNYLLTTVNGVAPSSSALASAVASLNTNRGDYLWHLAESTTNQAQVNLAGLALAGVEYL
jgi:Ca2+-binding RTX toxin-like protein